jgi:polyhydroxyalkanoate synthesis repressor PhaR
MGEPKVIKRYANRKLYDTERSCYVTLDEIAEMVKDGDDVRVIDNKSKDDLTAVTLAQIIVEEEKKVSRMPLKLLRSIIQSGNEAIGDFYQKRVADPAKSLRDDVERQTQKIFRKKDGEDGEDEEGSADGEAPAADGDEDDEAGGPVKEFVSSTQAAFESFQRRIDERVKEALSAMTHLTHVGTDVEGLRDRIKELEARLDEAEKKRDA